METCLKAGNATVKPEEIEAMVTDDKGLTDSSLSFRDDYMKCVYILMRVS